MEELQEEVKDEFRQEYGQKMSESLNTIAMAATAKQDFMDQGQSTMSTLTTTNADLSQKLTEMLSKNAALEARMARMEQQDSGTPRAPGGRVKTEEEGFEYGTAKNSAGEMCATRKGGMFGRTKNFWFFVEKQYCANCKKETRHLPQYCPALPNNKKRKADAIAREKARERK